MDKEGANIIVGNNCNHIMMGNNGNDIATWQEWLDEEGAHEEADADEEVERVDERSAPLWTEGKDEEDTVGREEDSITSKLENAKNG